MTHSKLFSLVLRVLVLPLSLLAMIIGLLMVADVSVPLERLRAALVSTASEAAGRDIRIDGEVRVAISFFPTLVVDQLHISNSPGWKSEDMLTVDMARVQISLLPLLSGHLEFLEIAAEDIVVNLEQKADGRSNWSNSESHDDAVSASTPETESLPKRNISNKLTIEEFSLTNLTLNYHDEKLGRDFTDRVDRLQINTEDHARLVADLTGSSGDTQYAFQASSDLLRNLTMGEAWRFDVDGHIGNEPVALSASIDTSGGVIDGNAELTASNVDIGKTLDWLGITEGLDLEFRGTDHGFSKEKCGLSPMPVS